MKKKLIVLLMALLLATVFVALTGCDDTADTTTAVSDTSATLTENTTAITTKGTVATTLPLQDGLAVYPKNKV